MSEKPFKSSPKILLWDLETAKMKLSHYTYSLKQFSKYISPDAIERDIWMVCGAWKWLDQPYVASTSVLNDPERFKENYADDYHVVKTIHDLLSEADILIAHNGDNFDWKIFTARCIANGLEPPSKPLMIDTLKAARKEFKFSSNALRYLARFLGVEDKGQSPKWDKVAVGDVESIKFCEQYCRQDIRTLEGIYLKMRPYITNHPNFNAILDGTHHKTCPKCGHWDVQKRGFDYTKTAKYQKYSCKTQTGGCGGWSRDKKNLKATPDLR